MIVNDKNSEFFKKAKTILDDFVLSGGDVNDLKRGDKIYNYIMGANICDKNGRKLTLEEKFAFLEHPRKAKYSNDVKASLIDAIENYLKEGGSFHITRKKLPFFELLSTYVRSLKRQGIEVTHEQAMKDLGYKEYSDLFYRCKDIGVISKFRDRDGYVDSYRQDQVAKAYIRDLSETLNIPTYMVLTLIADEKLKKCTLQLDYVKYVRNGLYKFISDYGSLKGIKREAPAIYESLHHLSDFYIDKSGKRYSKKEWLKIFGIDDVDNLFKDVEEEQIDVEDIFANLKLKFKNKPIQRRDLDDITYRTLLNKATRKGISLSELFAEQDLVYDGITIDRLARTTVNKVPYLKEMKARRDEILKENGMLAENGYCKEELFEAKVRAAQQVYLEFKEKLENYNPFTTGLDGNIVGGNNTDLL